MTQKLYEKVCFIMQTHSLVYLIINHIGNRFHDLRRVNILLNEVNIEVNDLVIQPSLTMSQLICSHNVATNLFNAQTRKQTENILRHQTRRATPLPDYLCPKIT